MRLGTPLPEYPRHPRASGSHHFGINPPTIHPLIFQACSTKDGINVQTYEALGTRIDLVGLVDIVEMHHVRDSWNHADMFEADRQRDLATEQQRMQAAATPRGRRRRGR